MTTPRSRADLEAEIASALVPADLRGPGMIALRQTTYWDVVAASGASYRIHFRDKVESAFAEPAYRSIDVDDVHPLLVRYDEPTRSLYFSGTPLRPREVAEQIERDIRDASGSWRGLHDYATSTEAVERSLRDGHGMLLQAPAPVCCVVAQILEAAGIQCSILGNAPVRPGKRVLLLGRSYVIASGFAFARQDQ